MSQPLQHFCPVALELAIGYAKERSAFDQPLSHFQATQFKIVDMATKIEAARSITYRAALAIDRGKFSPELSAMAKWYAAKVAVEVVDEALQIHGGYGYFSDYGISRFYRDVKALEIYEGTKDIEKLLIGRRLLGIRG